MWCNSWDAAFLLSRDFRSSRRLGDCAAFGRRAAVSSRARSEKHRSVFRPRAFGASAGALGHSSESPGPIRRSWRQKFPHHWAAFHPVFILVPGPTPWHARTLHQLVALEKRRMGHGYQLRSKGKLSATRGVAQANDIASTPYPDTRSLPLSGAAAITSATKEARDERPPLPKLSEFDANGRYVRGKGDSQTCAEDLSRDTPLHAPHSPSEQSLARGTRSQCPSLRIARKGLYESLRRTTSTTEAHDKKDDETALSIKQENPRGGHTSSKRQASRETPITSKITTRASHARRQVEEAPTMQQSYFEFGLPVYSSDNTRSSVAERNPLNHSNYRTPLRSGIRRSFQTTPTSRLPTRRANFSPRTPRSEGQSERNGLRSAQRNTSLARCSRHGKEIRDMRASTTPPSRRRVKRRRNSDSESTEAQERETPRSRRSSNNEDQTPTTDNRRSYRRNSGPRRPSNPSLIPDSPADEDGRRLVRSRGAPRSPPVTIPRYKKGDDLEVFCFKFLAYLKRAKIKRQRLHEHLLENIQDEDTYRKIRNLRFSADEENDPNKLMSRVSRAILEPRICPESQRMELKDLKQQDWERVDEFADRIGRIAERAFLGETYSYINRRKLEVLQDGLRNREVAELVYECKLDHCDFDEVVTWATQKEANLRIFRNQPANLADAEMVHAIQEARLRGPASQSENAITCSHCNKRGHTKEQCWQRQTCQLCLQFGHGARNCPEGTRYVRGFGGRGRQNRGRSSGRENGRGRLRCYACNDVGHYAADCPTRRFPSENGNAIEVAEGTGTHGRGE